MRNETVNQVFLELVWSTLSENGWLSLGELRAASGVDDSTLMRIVNFLIRWNFAEARCSPSLQLRRKSGAISPIDIVGLLRAVNDTLQTGAATTMIPERGFRVAERVACRACGGKVFRRVGENEVECSKCHERQWRTIEIQGPKQLAFVSAASDARAGSNS